MDKSNILLIIFKRQDGEGFIISVDGQNVFTCAEEFVIDGLDDIFLSGCDILISVDYARKVSNDIFLADVVDHEVTD